MHWTLQYNPITDDGDEVWVDEPQQPNPQDGYDETEWLCSELAGSEEGRKKMVAALTPENLAALGYVPEPVWRDAKDIPQDHVEVVALVDFAGDLIPLIGHMPDPSAHKKFHAAQNNVLGVPLSMIRGWYPLPALPGKGE